MSTININVSKADMGLNNVDNTSDLNKPISTATQTALDNKVDKVTGSRLITSSEATDIGYLSGVSQNVQNQLNAKVNLNTLITPSTGTKVTYDAKGLILSSTNITTSDVSGLGTLATQSTIPCVIQLACSDETTAITAGTGKVTFRMPHAMTLTGVRASLTTAQTSGNIFTVDINEGGASVISTKITIDNTEKTSTTAVTAPVISDSSLADDAEITIDVDQIGDGTAKGLKVTLIGTRAV